MKGLAWAAIGQWSGKAASFLVFLVLSRLLKPEDFGLIALASVFTAFLAIFHQQGFGDAIIQRADLEPAHLDTAFWTGLTLASLLTFGTWLAAGSIAGLFHEERLAPVLAWLSIGFVLEALSNTQASILRRELAFRSLAMRTLASITVGGVSGIILAYLGFGVWSLVGQTLFGSMAGIVVLWTSSKWRPRLVFSRKHFGDLFSFGRNMIAINVLDFLNRRSDDFLIGYFLGPTLLGYYTIAYKLLLTMTDLLTRVSSTVAFPLFSRIQDHPERLRRGFFTVTRFTSLIAFPAFLGVVVLAPEIIVIVFGEKWAPSIPVMRVLAFIGILQSVYFFNRTILLAKNKPSWSLKLGILNSVSNVTAFAVAVHWGIVAVAAAYVIRGYLLSPLPVWLVSRLIHFRLSEYLRQYIPAVAGSCSMVAVLLLFRQFLDLSPSWQTMCFEIVLGGLVYFGVVLSIAPADARQAIGYARILLPQSIGSRL